MIKFLFIIWGGLKRERNAMNKDILSSIIDQELSILSLCEKLFLLNPNLDFIAKKMRKRNINLAKSIVDMK